MLSWIRRNPPQHKGRLTPEFDRVYHYHIRKTAGSSLNAAFLSAFAGKRVTVKALAGAPKHRIAGEIGPAVGWNERLIKAGSFAYAFSHSPFHSLKVPAKTCTFTVFRDPVERAYSHFLMLKGYIENGVDHPCLASEGDWAKGDFADFIASADRDHLLRQLYMFSENFDVDEAVEAVSSLDQVGFFHELGNLLESAQALFSVDLPMRHENRSLSRKKLSAEELAAFRPHFEPEYEMLVKIRERKG